MLRTERYPRKGADGAEVLDVGGAERVARFDGCGGDEGVGQLNAVGQGVLLDEGGAVVPIGSERGRIRNWGWRSDCWILRASSLDRAP